MDYSARHVTDEISDKIDATDTEQSLARHVTSLPWLTMSYTVNLRCGCQVYVSCHPRTGVAHTRVIEFRSPQCGIRSHDVGVRIPAWELLSCEPDEPVDGKVAVLASRSLAPAPR